MFFALATFSAITAADADVERLLRAEQAPSGVVFEIVEPQRDALAWAIPAVRRHAERLRERFADLPIAVVTHGPEQFALLSSGAEGEYAAIHDQARQLGGEAIDLHVCGVHASWYDHVPEDFPSYVDVSASGPAQINDYRALGYEVIELERED